MRIVCWQTILMKYHTLIFFKNLDNSGKICRLLQSWLALQGLKKVKKVDRWTDLSSKNSWRSKLTKWLDK